MTPIVISTYNDLRAVLGRDLGVGAWVEIAPDQVARFASACRGGRFQQFTEDGPTVAGGSHQLGELLLLSLLGRLRSTMESVKFSYASTMNIFYGYDNVRFFDRLSTPAKIRLHLKVVDAKLLDDSTIHAIYGHRLETSEGHTALTADVINRIHLRRSAH